MLITLKNTNPIIILKYSFANSCVSELLPAHLKIVSEYFTNTNEIIAVKTAAIANAVTKTVLAEFLSSSPFRRATSADTATFIEKKNDSPINFGWFVSPTAAIASFPKLETINVSISPVSVIKKLSKTDGHATFIALE